SARDVRHQEHYRVGGKKHFWNYQSTISAVVQRALEVLHCVRLIRVALERIDEPGERSDALGAHRISLVRHRRRADLLAFERLFDLAEALQHADVAAELRGTCRDSRHDTENERVELARVRLARD